MVIVLFYAAVGCLILDNVNSYWVKSHSMAVENVSRKAGYSSKAVRFDHGSYSVLVFMFAKIVYFDYLVTIFVFN